MIAARHPHVSQYKLREEGQIESDEDDQCGELGGRFGIHSARHLGPPEMKSAEICEHHATDHYVVKVSDHKISVMHVHIDAKRGKEEAGQSADGEQSQKGDGIEHWSLEMDRATIHGRRPVKDL